MSISADRMIALVLHRQRAIFRLISKHLLAFSEQIEQHLVDTTLELNDPFSSQLGTGQLLLEPEELRHALDYFFPQTLRASLFLMTFADLEHYFCKVTCEIQSAKQSRLKVSDLHGNGIEQAHKYLTKVADLAISKNVWEKVCFLKILRNVIVRSGRSIELNSKLHKTFSTEIKKWGMRSVELSENGFLVLDKGFNHSAIEACSDLFEDLVVQNYPELHAPN